MSRGEELREMLGRLPCGSPEFDAVCRELKAIELGAWGRISTQARACGSRVDDR
jgi:hypothetical protein